MNRLPSFSTFLLVWAVVVPLHGSGDHEAAPAQPPGTPPVGTEGHSQASPSEAPAAPSGPAGEVVAKTPVDEQASLLRLGETKLVSGDLESALVAYNAVASAAEDPLQIATALLGLARTLRKSGEGVKAAATYELLLRDHPDFGETPSALLELGRTYRELGSPKLAIARFYSVLNATLRMPEAEGLRYRRTVRTAQFEIAETHLSTGDYATAIKFFNRLNLLDLAPVDRARARFKVAYARLLAGEDLAALTALRSFIEQEPVAEQNPEARFLLATLLAKLGRHDESLQVTLDLLRHEHERVTPNASAWLAWQRRTGNQLANQFYTRSDFMGALLLFRALAELDAAQEWRLPILYQIGLCEERLNQQAAALEAYGEIAKVAGDKPLPMIADIVRMAAWRADQLGWFTRAQVDLGELGPPPLPPAAVFAPNAPSAQGLAEVPLPGGPEQTVEPAPAGASPAAPAAPSAPAAPGAPSASAL